MEDCLCHLILKAIMSLMSFFRYACQQHFASYRNESVLFQFKSVDFFTISVFKFLNANSPLMLISFLSG